MAWLVFRHFVTLETPRRTHVHFQHGKFSNLPDIPPPVLQDLIRELAKCWLLHYLMPTSLLNFPFILVSPSYARYRISTTLLLVNREERSLNTVACSSSDSPSWPLLLRKKVWRWLLMTLQCREHSPLDKRSVLCTGKHCIQEHNAGYVRTLLGTPVKAGLVNCS